MKGMRSGDGEASKRRRVEGEATDGPRAIHAEHFAEERADEAIFARHDGSAEARGRGRGAVADDESDGDRRPVVLRRRTPQRRQEREECRQRECESGMDRPREVRFACGHAPLRGGCTAVCALLSEV